MGPAHALKVRWALAFLLAGSGFGGCTAPNPFFERGASGAPDRPTHRLDGGSADRPASAAIADAGPVGDGPIAAADSDKPEDGSFIPGSIGTTGTADAGTDAAVDDAALDDAAVDAHGDAAPADAGSPPDVVPAPILPVAHWRLDETSGQQVADASGNGNVGVLTRGASWTRDVPRARFADPSALRLDGFVGSVAITVKSLPALAAPKSITAWFLSDGFGAIGRRNIVALSNPSAAASIQLGLDYGRVAIWRWSNGGLVVNRAEATSAGWHHVAYVYNGAEHRLYFDGGLVDTSKVAALSAPVTNARLGSFDGAIEMFEGRLDDVRIYDQAISPAAVRALAAGEAGF